MLKHHQLESIKSTFSTNLKSGVHSHATGTGKSVIALQLTTQFINWFSPKIPTILWICEQKSILIEQFQKETLVKKGFDKSRFLILDFYQKKQSNWTDSVNASTFWHKPTLIIINRAFLVSQLKYLNIRIPIHLVIHDECHSISNKTTQSFYQWFIDKNPDSRIIGFSATPILIKPFDAIISKYSIYDSVIDNVILPPRIVWFKSDTIITHSNLIQLIKHLIKNQPYKKIIIWCGLISLITDLIPIYKLSFPDFKLCVDTSKTLLIDDCIGNYDDFYKTSANTILFCAAKHREGSDIPNLDTAIFLDKVQNRNAKTFVQCLGRVLRHDSEHRKQNGLIIDVRIKSPIDICDRMNTYLEIYNHFPWSYSYYPFHISSSNSIIINEITLNTDNKKDETIITYESKTIEDLRKRFKRKIPNHTVYKERLEMELDVIESKDLIKNLLYACDILDITENIPHITRGSCGSSLVCYILGISHVDPIKYRISFARFLNEYRNNLPDIDFDFPHYLRDEVFLKLHLCFPNKIARISNHIHFHEKSAIREAIRQSGYRKFIPKDQVNQFIYKQPLLKRQFIQKRVQELKNTFRTFSLHCGGIVYYPEGIPTKLKLPKTKHRMLSQIVLNKEDVSSQKLFKIDILSSRALSQLYEMYGYKLPDFETIIDDEATWKTFQEGNNIGLTLAESPLIRKAFLEIKPKSISDIAKCLAIIRPAAKSAKKGAGIVYDDDAIYLLSKLLRISEDEADFWRRILSKPNAKTKLNSLKTKVSKETFNTIIKLHNDLRQYSFCKAHAFSYAQLVFQLGFMKTHYPMEFWRATLNHAESHYRKWVHLYEAKLAGVDYRMEDLKKNNVSIYAVNRRKNIEKLD